MEVLAELLRAPEQRPADPFTPVEITVGSLGMERWLRHELAVRHGVCANVRFPFPEQLLASRLAPLLGQPVPTPDAAPADPWSRDVLTWSLLEVLADAEGGPASWPPQMGAHVLETYLAHGGAVSPAQGGLAQVGAREYELAQRVADVFDGYITYRPEWACAASAGELELDPGDPLRWQIPLWAALQRRAGGDDPRHRAAQLAGLDQAQRRGESPASLPAQAALPVRIFGLSSLPPTFLAFLEVLAHRVPVELYLVCPSNAYWSDLHRHRGTLVPLSRDTPRDELGERMRERLGPDSRGARPHPLLSSMGRVARDLQIQLERLPDALRRGDDLFIDELAARDVEAFPDPAGVVGGARAQAVPALLRLQSDILHLREPGELAAPVPDRDDSIQFHACHGATRQVEVLREVLSHLFDAHPHLQPRDVVVMCPDIDTYAPLISAVFDDGRDERRGLDGGADLSAEAFGHVGAPRIPYRVADLSVRRQNPVAEALLRMLALGGAASRVSASAVLDLLALEPVRRRFGLEETDLEQLGEWVRASGVRWGVDAEDRAEAGQPGVAQNTWVFGLERLVLGVTIADDGELVQLPASTAGAGHRPGALDVVAPFDPMEGSRVELLGRLMDFTEVLFGEVEALETPRTVDDWAAHLDGLIDRLTRLTPEASWLAQRVRETLTQMREAAQLAGSTRPLEREAMHVALEHRFSVASSSAQPHTGAVTFGTLMPYRSVPYRVVCLLGMDDGAFPRNPVRAGFDRVAVAPRVGDRDVRDEDRHLLLEAITSAREHLVVTYAGRDIKKNEPLPPAAPVGELMDVLATTFGETALDAMCFEHPLQAFSPRNFTGGPAALGRDGAPWSYDRRLRRGAEALLAGRQAHVQVSAFLDGEPEGSAAERDTQLSLEQLVRYFRNPARYLLKEGFKVYLGEREEGSVDREPVELDHLESWKLTDALLDARTGEAAAGARQLAHRVARMRAVGELPLGVAGDEAVAAADDAVAELMARLGDAANELVLAGVDDDGGEALRLAPPDPPLALNLAFEVAPGTTVKLSGTVGRRHGDTLLRVMSGKGLVRGRAVTAWLEYLAAVVATGGEVRRALVGLTRAAPPGTGKAPTVELISLALPATEAPDAARRAETARDLLRRYVDWASLGRRNPLPLFDYASDAFVSKMNGGKTSWKGRTLLEFEGLGTDSANFHDAVESAQKAFAGSTKHRGDADDAFVTRLWPEGWTDDAHFCEVSMAFWWPLRVCALGGTS